MRAIAVSDDAAGPGTSPPSGAAFHTTRGPLTPAIVRHSRSADICTRTRCARHVRTSGPREPMHKLTVWPTADRRPPAGAVSGTSTPLTSAELFDIRARGAADMYRTGTVFHGCGRALYRRETMFPASAGYAGY